MSKKDKTYYRVYDRDVKFSVGELVFGPPVMSAKTVAELRRNGANIRAVPIKKPPKKK